MNLGAIGTIARLLQQAPAAANLAVIARRAAAGDPEAIEYLRRQGWHEALDLAVPGAGQMAVATLEGARNAYETFVTGGVVEGEYREVSEKPPYARRFVPWLAAQRMGTFVFLGPKGMGKTAGAQRLAEVWHDRTGYRVDQINFDPRDQKRLPWANNVSMSKFAREMQMLAKAWDQASSDDPDEQVAAKRVLRTMKRRVVLIDEASMAISPTGPLSGKTAARVAMSLARHLDYLCVYIGQFARQMPADLLSCEAVFVRQPKGNEGRLDRDNPVVIDLWERATEAFSTIRSYPWFSESPIMKSWAYVDAPGVYSGLCPFAMPAGDDSDEDVDDPGYDDYEEDED